MIERLLIVIVLAIIGFIAYKVFTRQQLSRAAASVPSDLLLRDVKRDTATIVYFTTPQCTPCRLQQTPTLNSLKEELGENIQIVRVDATEDPEAADRWGVMTVPTTFVLDREHRPRHVHNGVVDAATLKRQLLAS